VSNVVKKITEVSPTGFSLTITEVSPTVGLVSPSTGLGLSTTWGSPTGFSLLGQQIGFSSKGF